MLSAGNNHPKRYLDRVLRRNLWCEERESERLGEREPLDPLLGEPRREPLEPLLGEPLSELLDPLPGEPLDPLLGEPLRELLGGETLLLPPLCKLVLSGSSLLPRPQPSLDFEPILTKGSLDTDLRGPFSSDASLDLL